MSTARLAAEMFWQNLTTGNYDALDEVMDATARAYEENPLDPHATLLRAHANFWGFGELDRNPEATPELEAEYVSGAYRYFYETMILDPNDYRLPAWTAAMGINLGAGTGDFELLGASLELMEQAKALYPEWSNFVDAFVFSGQPFDHPLFARAVESIWAGFEACLGEPLDRSNPDYAPHLDKATIIGPKRVCWNGPKAPHSIESTLVEAGDIMLKANNIAAAEVFYRNAQLIPEYESWPFKSELEERLASDLAERAARFRDADPENDPPVGIDQAGCTMCHGR